MHLTEWWQRRWTIALVTLFAAVPLVWPQVPPLADLPGHMASFHVSISLRHSTALQRFYGFDWHLIGNLGVDLLVIPIGKIIGVELATKVIVITIPLLTAFALLMLARQAHGKLPATALAAVPLVYNDPFNFGFVNYSLAAAIALLGLWWWQAWPVNRYPLRRTLVFGVAAIVIWLAHTIGWIAFSAICAAAQLANGRVEGKPPSAAMRDTIVACLSLGLPVILIPLGPHANHASIGRWFSIGDLIRAVVGCLRDRWIAWDVFSVALLLGFCCAAQLRLAKLKMAPTLGWPALALFLLFLAFPKLINGSDFFNTRLFCYSLALAVVAIRTDLLPIYRQRLIAVICAAFLGARLIGNVVSFYLYDESYRRELGALDKIPEGAKILSLVQIPCQKPGQGWTRHRLEHLPALAVVRRNAFVNDLWTIQGLQLLRDRMPRAAPFRNDPSEFVSRGGCSGYPSPTDAIAGAPLNAFGFIWLIGVPKDERPNNFHLKPVWTGNDSILYRVNGPFLDNGL